MTPEEQQYIVENAKKLSPKQIAGRLHLKERTVTRFLERRQIKVQAQKSPEFLPPPQGPPLPFFLTCLGMTVLGFLIYSNSFQAGFHFDDDRSILFNYSIRSLDPSAIWGFSKSRFLTYLSLALNYHFTKFDLFGFHLTNLLIHLAAGAAVYLLTLLTFQTPALAANPFRKHAPTIASVASLIFLSHPIQTQAVTYIIQRTASLATLFYIGSVVLYAKARLAQKSFFYFASILAALAAMLTKEISFTLPLMIVLYELTFFPKFFQNLSKRIPGLLPFLALLAVLPAIFIFQYGLESDSIASASKETESITRAHYLLTQINVVRTYLRLLAAPLNQHLDYAYPISRHLFEPPALLSLLLHLGLLALAVLIFRRQRILAFAIFWFYAALSVESSIIPIRDVIFEHRLYLPMAGVSIFFSYGLYCLVQDSKKFWAISIPIVLLLAFLTYQRNFVWKDEISLWSDSAKKSPLAERPYHNLAIAYHEKGDEDKALENYEKALQLNDKLAKAYNAVGVILIRRGEKEKGIEYFKKSIEADPESFESYANLGTFYLYEHQYEKAIENHIQAVQKDPDPLKRNSWKPLYELGVAYFLMGNIEKAKEITEWLKEIGKTDFAQKLNRIRAGEEDPFSPLSEKPPPGGVEIMNIQ